MRRDAVRRTAARAGGCFESFEQYSKIVAPLDLAETQEAETEKTERRAPIWMGTICSH
jgi:hypothetical protein